MHNKEVIEHIQRDYKKITKIFGRKFKNHEHAEDCLQQLLLKLCRKEYNITHPKSFIKRAMFMIFSNHKRSNKRLSFNSISYWGDLDDDKNTSLRGLPVFYPSIIDDIDHSEVLEIVYNAIDSLPPKQRAAILNRYSDKENNTNNINTEKTNYRQGFIKLKEKLNDFQIVETVENYI